MKELREILAAYKNACARGESAVLANVVRAEGSTYRRCGARLLVGADESMTGLVSGGCVEGDLLEHAREVAAGGAPKLLHYDSRAQDDILWGLGLGCAGVVSVLLERVSAGAPGPLAWLGEWLAKRRRAVLATSLAQPLGARAALVQGAEGEVQGASAARANSVLRRAMQNMLQGETVAAQNNWALELFTPPLRLIIFGAGPDARPLAQLAAALGWETQVLDHRPAFAQAAPFAGAHVRCVPVENAVRAAAVDAESYCVVMTHHFLHDCTLLGGLLAGPARHIALLGPKQRSADLLAELAKQGALPSAELARASARISAPAGLDLGADAPEQVALAIAAEIQALSAGREGGRLRDRRGPIH